MAKKEMKLDDLARMIQEGFLDTSSQIKTLGSKVDKLDSRIETLDQKVTDQGHQIDKVDLHLSAYASRWSDDFEKLHEWVKEIDSRVKFVEKQIQK